MALLCERVNPLTSREWNALVASRTPCNLFHSAEWARVLAESYGYEPHYLVVRRDGRMRAVIPFMQVDSFLTGRRGVSLPFSDRCDPIVEESVDLPGVLAAVAHYAESAGWRYLDFHGGSNLLAGAPVSAEYVGHRLTLSADGAHHFEKIRDTTRRNIRRARRLGVAIRTDSTADALGEFYRLHCLTRRRHGLPAQPLRFFRSIQDRMLSNGMGHVVRAVYQHRTIGAAVFLHFGDEALFKFGASDLRYQHLRMNDLVLWEAIQWAARHGYRTFDFGRTDTWNEGLRRFKAAWGSEEYAIKYYRYDARRRAFLGAAPTTLAGLVKPAFRVMPISVSRMIGAAMYRHFG